MIHLLAGIGLGTIIALVVLGIVGGYASDHDQKVPNIAGIAIGLLCGAVGYLAIVAATGGF